MTNVNWMWIDRFGLQAGFNSVHMWTGLYTFYTFRDLNVLLITRHLQFLPKTS